MLALLKGLAQAPDPLDLAGQAERLGLIGVLAFVAIVFGLLLWRMHGRQIADKNAQIEQLRSERDASLLRERKLHAFMEDELIPLVSDANRRAARAMKVIADEE